MRTDAANVYERRGPTRGARLSERQELRPVPAGCAQKYRHPRQRDRDVGVSASEGVARIDDHAAVTGKDDAAPIRSACAAFVIWAGVRPPHSLCDYKIAGGQRTRLAARAHSRLAQHRGFVRCFCTWRTGPRDARDLHRHGDVWQIKLVEIDQDYVAAAT